MNTQTAKWTKTADGKWAARGAWELFDNSHVMVESRDGRTTLCRIVGTVPALCTDPTTDYDNYTKIPESLYVREITVEVEKETKSMYQLMREVPRGTRPY